MRLVHKFLLLVFTFLFITFKTGLPQTGKDWWKPMYDTGLELIEGKQFEDAREKFNRILKRNKKIAQAYYGLGLSYAAEKPDSKDALKQFKKAIKLDKQYAEAYYQSALVYINMEQFHDARDILYTATRQMPKFIDAWLTLGEIESKHGETSKAVEAYINAYQSNPDNEEIYNRLISTSIKHHEESRVIDFLKELTDGSDDIERLSDMAYLYHITGDHEKSMSIASAIPPDKLNARTLLLQANIHFNNENDAIGAACYWSAANNIKNQADVEAFLRDCIYLMNREEFNRLQETPLPDVWKFYYGFWRSRDPNLSTEENERLPEHYRRLNYARKWYRRTVSGDDRRYKLEHPFNEQFQVKVGSEMYGAYLYDFLQENRDLDDMGLIYIRHGEPDRTATAFDPELPQNMSWKFDEKWNHPELIFHFTKWGGGLGWILTSLPVTFEDRGDLGGIYVRMDPENPGHQELTLTNLLNSYDNIDEESRTYARLGIQTETSDFQYTESEPLNFPFHFTTFRGEKGKLLLEVYYGLSGAEAMIKSTKEGSFLFLEQFLGFYDKQWSEVAKSRTENKIKIRLTPEQWRHTNFVDVQRFQIKPGEHHFEFKIRDKVSGKMGIFKGEYQFADLWITDSLLISDVILSGPIRPTETAGKFVKQDIRYSPHMFSDFEIGSEIGLYFEIYNLLYNPDGQTNFRITCTLRPIGGAMTSSKNIAGVFKSLFDKKGQAVSTSYDYTGEIPNEKIYMNFDLKGYDAGRYELVVDVTDLQSKNSVRQRVNLKIRG